MTKNKKRLVMLLVFVMLFSLIPTAGIAKRHASRDIKIVVSDYFVMSDVHPFIENDRTFVPIRFIAEELGYNVRWEQATKKVYITSGNTTIVLTIGSNVAQVNGANQTLDAAAMLRDDRTFVPLRFIAESMGEQVDYNLEARVAYVNSPNIIINQFFDIKYYEGNNQPIILNVSYNPDSNTVKDKETGKEAPVPDDKTAAEFVDDVFENKDNPQWRNRVFEGTIPAEETRAQDDNLPKLEGYWYIKNPEDYGYEKYAITLDKVESGVYNAVVEVKVPGYHNIYRTQAFYEAADNLLFFQDTADFDELETKSGVTVEEGFEIKYNANDDTLVRGGSVLVRGEAPDTSSSDVPEDKQLKDKYYVSPTDDDFIVGSWWGTSSAEGIGYLDSYFTFTKTGTNRYIYTNQIITPEKAALITQGEAEYNPSTGELHIFQSNGLIKAEYPFDETWVTYDGYLGFEGTDYMYYTNNRNSNFSKY